MPTHYKIGTRGSLLALTQCEQIKEQLEAKTGDTFELVVIKTQGDVQTDKPLWQMEGNNFFTKELDEALLKGEVDLVTHSYKDLGSGRPEGIELACVSKRSYAHDILLIRKDVIPTIKNRTEFTVGTSSPRRVANIEKNLAPFLPKGKNVTIKTKVLRGNVNTRIQKLRDKEYDAIVLALPGLERLALTPSSLEELKKLLSGLNFMILPQSVFPSAAAQGALALECKKDRGDDGELRRKLALIEDQKTKEEVFRERQAFNSYGGGCHLPVGINVRKLATEKGELFLHCHQGQLKGEAISVLQLEGRTLPSFLVPPKTFDGHPTTDQLLCKKNIPLTLDPGLHLYATSRYCLEAVVQGQPHSVWAAGTKTMKELAALGFWVNATADALGDDEIKSLRDSRVVSLMADTRAPLIVLSNDEAKSSLTNAEVIPCYKREINPEVPEEFKRTILATEVFYWTSFFQYETYLQHFPEIKNKIHACGVGKTYDLFRNSNIDVYPMAGMEEFKAWTQS